MERTTAEAPRDRLPPPPIDMPDPSQPAPSHFLRNQPGLLGRAGMVSGVDPARIRHGGPTGATAAEPIVVEDVPMRLPSSPPANSRAATWNLPSNVTPEDVVRTLDKQSVVPLLQNMFQFFVTKRSIEKEKPPPFFRRNVPPERPTKKRKLTRVPAGAADWDVPFPFEEGDGPEGYRESWEKERAKKLVSQIVDIFKDAAAKASQEKMSFEQAKQAELAAVYQSSTPQASSGSPSSDIDQLLQQWLGHGLNDLSNGQSPSSDSSVDQWMETLNHMVPDMGDSSGFENLSFDEMLNQFTGGPIDLDPTPPPPLPLPSIPSSSMAGDSLTFSSASSSRIPNSSIDPVLLALTSQTRQDTPSLSLGASTPSTTPGPDTPHMGFMPFNSLSFGPHPVPYSSSSDFADQEWLDKPATTEGRGKNKGTQPEKMARSGAGSAADRRETVRKAKDRRDIILKELRKNDDERRKLTIEHAVLSRLAMHYNYQ